MCGLSLTWVQISAPPATPRPRSSHFTSLLLREAPTPRVWETPKAAASAMPGTCLPHGLICYCLCLAVNSKCPKLLFLFADLGSAASQQILIEGGTEVGTGCCLGNPTQQGPDGSNGCPTWLPHSGTENSLCLPSLT